MCANLLKGSRDSDIDPTTLPVSLYPGSSEDIVAAAQDLTVRGHADRVEAATTNPSSAIHVSHPEMFITEPQLTRTDLLSKALFPKYANVAWDPHADSVRKRLDSNATVVVQNAASAPLHPGPVAVNQAMFLCERIGKAIQGQPSVADGGMWSAMISKERCKKMLPYLLMNVYWRARKQMAVFEVFAILYRQGFFPAEALSLPIDYWHTSDNVANVMRMLGCFTKIADLTEPPDLGSNWTISEFGAPAHWLAVMICRSCYDLDEVSDVLSLIGHSGLLGRMSKSAIKEFIADRRRQKVKAATPASPVKGKGKGKAKQEEPELGPLFTMNEMENAAAKQQRSVVALFLPSGVGSDVEQLFDDANRTFVEIEQVFMDFFGATQQQLMVDDPDEGSEGEEDE
ncbi:MAG: hypothetical protein Q9208_003640 [Pyrenodesmia sp. 3 TL-2023]